MPDTRYRKGGAYAADMAVYARAMASDNSAQMSRVKRNLLRALREDVTPRQREMLLLYYGEQLNMRQIGTRLGVDKSTVSRTIKRGERRLQRCLRYGAEAFLWPTDRVRAAGRLPPGQLPPAGAAEYRLPLFSGGVYVVKRPVRTVSARSGPQLSRNSGFAALGAVLCAPPMGGAHLLIPRRRTPG